jgi:hypothetical protein
LTGRKCKDGWHECHAINRPDVNPSASFNEASGVYHDFGTGTKLSLFDLAAAMGIYPDGRTAFRELAAKFLDQPRRRERSA